MEEDIGHAAGLIWRYLDQHGETTLGRLKQAAKLDDQLLYMALGWLAREARLNFVRDKKSTRLSLKAP